jgi:transcriptional regulator with XRE-family HTH domain
MTGPTEERLALAARVRALRAERLPYREIAQRLGISRSYASMLVTDSDGSKQQRRRESYAGVCESCGASTDGSNGPNAAPRFCHLCAEPANKRWTRENVISAIQAFALAFGRPPQSIDWNTTLARRFGGVGTANGHFPSVSTVQELFGSWANAIEVAGFPRPSKGTYKRTDSTLDLLSASTKARLDRERSQKTHCKQGHDLRVVGVKRWAHPTTTLRDGSPLVVHSCAECRRLHTKRAYERRKARAAA